MKHAYLLFLNFLNKLKNMRYTSICRKRQALLNSHCGYYLQFRLGKYAFCHVLKLSLLNDSSYWK
eukprot:UN04142